MQKKNINYKRLFSATLQLLLFIGYIFSCITILPMEATDFSLYLNVFCLCLSMSVGLLQNVLELMEKGMDPRELRMDVVSVVVLAICSLFILVMGFGKDVAFRYPALCSSFARSVTVAITFRQALTMVFFFFGAYETDKI